MTRGEIYRSRTAAPERGGKRGFYVIVSRSFIAENDGVSTVICAPVYGNVLGLSTEVLVGPQNGVPRDSAIRCGFITLMFKRKLTEFVGSLGETQSNELDQALAVALQLD